jgi:hypothetical protein
MFVTDATSSATANFAPLTNGQYALTVDTVGYGRVAAYPSANAYNPGQSVQLSATPSPGQSFLGWSGDVSTSTNPINVLMNQSLIVTGAFSKRPMLSVPLGSVALSPAGFKFLISGDYGAVYQVLSSSNLSDWYSVGSVTNSFGAAQFLDATATGGTPRFYRIQAQ